MRSEGTAPRGRFGALLATLLAAAASPGCGPRGASTPRAGISTQVERAAVSPPPACPGTAPAAASVPAFPLAREPVGRPQGAQPHVPYAAEIVGGQLVTFTHEDERKRVALWSLDDGTLIAQREINMVLWTTMPPPVASVGDRLRFLVGRSRTYGCDPGWEVQVISLWPLRGPAPLRERVTEHCIRNVGWVLDTDPLAMRVAAERRPGQIEVVDVEDERRVVFPQHAHARGATFVAGGRLVSSLVDDPEADAKSAVVVQDVATGRTLFAGGLYDGGKQRVSAAAVAPDGRRLALANRSHWQVLELPGGRKLADQHASRNVDLAYSSGREPVLVVRLIGRASVENGAIVAMEPDQHEVWDGNGTQRIGPVFPPPVLAVDTDRRLVVLGAWSQRMVELRSLGDGSTIAWLASFYDGEYAAVAPDGAFVASPHGRRRVGWRFAPPEAPMPRVVVQRSWELAGRALDQPSDPAFSAFEAFGAWEDPAALKARLNGQSSRPRTRPAHPAPRFELVSSSATQPVVRVIAATRIERLWTQTPGQPQVYARACEKVIEIPIDVRGGAVTIGAVDADGGVGRASLDGSKLRAAD